MVKSPVTLALLNELEPDPETILFNCVAVAVNNTPPSFRPCVEPLWVVMSKLLPDGVILKFPPLDTKKST